MLKLKKTAVLLLVLMLLLSACSKTGEKASSETVLSAEDAPISTVTDPKDMFSDRDYETAYDENKCGKITFSGTTVKSSTDAAKISGSRVEIIEEGTYILCGTLTDGQVVVNAEKTDKIQLVLKGADITSKTSAAIYVLQADKVFITTAKGTENTLKNGGAFEAIDDNNIDGAIFSKDDLTLNGEGKLSVESPAGHGVVCKDDLVVTSGEYAVSSASQALNGKQSVRIAGGTFNLTAGKDGIHAEDNDDLSLGYGYISGGAFTITAEGDGISASNSLQIAGGEFTVTAGGGSENASSASSDNYGGFPGGGGFGGGRPGGGMGGKRSSVTTTTTETESTSMKGIKAGGNLDISGGTFKIDSADDALHSNMSLAVAAGTFEIASGDDAVHAEEKLTVSGGKFTITESYEGLEALHIVVSGGDISLVASDDGLNAAGGTDNSGAGGRDQMFGGGMGGPGGMSAGNGSILISGGVLAVKASGDGIDANGTLEITGGYTTVCGPTQGDTATLDYDKSAIISGGTFIGTGAAGMAQTFSSSENQGIIALQVGSAAASAEIILKDSRGKEVVRYAPALGYNVVILSTPDIQKGETYTITIGDQSGEFTAN